MRNDIKWLLIVWVGIVGLYLVFASVGAFVKLDPGLFNVKNWHEAFRFMLAVLWAVWFVAVTWDALENWK